MGDGCLRFSVGHRQRDCSDWGGRSTEGRRAIALRLEHERDPELVARARYAARHMRDHAWKHHETVGLGYTAATMSEPS
jgi:hypothetical protein